MKNAWRPLKVLVIDDDPEILETYEDILDEHNIKSVTCTDGVSGLERLRCENFDLIILDNNMPEFNGTEITRLARFTLAEMNIPIIMISGLNLRLNTMECMTCGINSFLKKPIEPKTLINTIKKVVEEFQNGSQCVWV